MPYSFTQIEKDRSHRIGFVFLFLIFFYFIVSLSLYCLIKFYFLLKESQIYARQYEYHAFVFKLSLEEVLTTLLVAFIIAVLHFLFSTNNIIEKVMSILQAQPINPQDTYHSRFKNVLDEVMVALGGVNIEGVVVPSSALNAFSLSDLNGRSVIGITEGLLSRLNRAQLEAVVAHEAAHIVSGDCLETTVTTSLFDLYGEMLSTIQDGLRVTSRLGEFTAIVLVGYVFLKGILLIAGFFKMLISRDREYRADAVAVRLTRDPLSLAEALYMIARRWRGAGLPGDGLESIFIINPQFNETDEETSLFSDLFSTHPPLQKRLDILLDMAHAGMKQLQDEFDQAPPKEPAPDPVVSPVSVLKVPEVKTSDNVSGQQWEVYNNGQWRGPFLVPQLMSQGWIEYDAFVRKVGDNKVVRLFEASDIKQFNTQGGKTSLAGVLCPQCHTNLSEDVYKGAPILRCVNCAGVLLYENDVHKILARDDYYFSDQIRSIGDSLIQQQNRSQIQPVDLKTANLFVCPRCADNKTQMLRSFYTIVYPVEIDRCVMCQSIWFERNELEVLQYLVGKTQ